MRLVSASPPGSIVPPVARPRAGSIPVAASAYEVIEVIEGVAPPESSTVRVVASPYLGVRFPAPRLMGAPLGFHGGFQ